MWRESSPHLVLKEDNMAEFSLQECAQKLGIIGENGSYHVDALYAKLDQLILRHRNYLEACLYERTRNLIQYADRQIWFGVLLRSLKMAIESEIGGAVKQEYSKGSAILERSDRKNNGLALQVQWVTGDIKFFRTFETVLTERQKQDVWCDIYNGKKNLISIFGKTPDNLCDQRRQFEFECDIMNFDRARLSPKSCYLWGTRYCLKQGIEDEEQADMMASEFEMYVKMMPQQRMKDLYRLRQGIQEINQSDPFVIALNQCLKNNNRGRGREE